MAYATDAELLVYVPAAAAVPVELRTLALEDTRADVCDGLYGARARKAHAMLAAHALALNPASGLAASQPVASRKAGAIATTYVSSSAGSDSPYGRSAYGLAYLAIRDSVPHAPTAV